LHPNLPLEGHRHRSLGFTLRVPAPFLQAAMAMTLQR